MSSGTEEESLLHLMAGKHGGDEEDEDKSKVLLAKGVTMVVLCTVSICMGLVPMLITRCLHPGKKDGVTNPRSLKLVGLLLGFGGGVLFATTFLHMQPEVAEGVEHLVSEGRLPRLNFSLADTLMCTGFFIMYLVEELVQTHLRRRQAREPKVDVNRSTNELVENGNSTNGYSNGHSHTNGSGHGHGHSHHLPIMDDSDDFVITSLRGLLIVLGLSVHELFEGLAIGLESSAGYVWYMFGAVAAHKFVIAFCIGVELMASRTKRFLAVIYICTFAVVSPLGIGIGMLLVGGGSAAASGALAVILQGLASGTLLYVVFFEILQEHRAGLQQYLSILVGFVLMFGLQILTAHSHSHDGHGHGHSHAHGHEHSHNHSHALEEHALGSEHYLDHDNPRTSYQHGHVHPEGDPQKVIGDAIEIVTDSIAETLSKAFTNASSYLRDDSGAESSLLTDRKKT